MSAELLKKSVLFKEFTPVGLQILARIARPRVVLAGKPLFVEGADAEALYLVIEGRFQIALKSSGGQNVPLGVIGPGEHLGEMALLAAERPAQHLCSAIAELDSRVLEFGRGEFQALMKEKPQACIKLLLALSQEFGQKVADSRDALRLVMQRALSR